MINEQNYFSGKINDLIQRWQRGETMVFSAFLTIEESEEASKICKNQKIPHFIYGGYDDAERKILAISSYDQDSLKLCFPIKLLSVCAYDRKKIGNRDILGALLGCGIRRECFGDIIARDGMLLFFAVDHIVDYLIDNLKSIGNQSVTLKEETDSVEIPPPHFEAFRTTVASLRLDAIIAALAHISRETASQFIKNGLVSINHRSAEKKTKDIVAGDRIIIRGYGKWIIDGCDASTKKGRIVLEGRKYI